MEYFKKMNLIKIVLIILISLSSSLFSQWYKVSAVIDSETLNDIIIINDSIILSVGELGTIKRSTDFGTSWTTVRGHYSYNDLKSIAFCNGIIMACGKHSELLISKDFGLNWEKKNSTNDEMFNSLALSEKYGLIVGNSGKIFKIDEDLENIKTIHTGYLEDLNDIIIINDSLSFVVGNNGLILRSDDAGENWYDVESETKSNLYCITKGMHNELIIGGSKSVILKSKDNYNSFVNEIQGKYNGYFRSLVYIRDSVIIAGFMEEDGIEKHAFSTDYGLTFYISIISQNINSSFCYSSNKETGFCCGSQGSVVRFNPDIDLNKVNFWGFLDIAIKGPEIINKNGISGINESLLTSYNQTKAIISYDSGITFQKVYDRHNSRCSIMNTRLINKTNILILEDSIIYVNDGTRKYTNNFPSITKFNINDNNYSRVYLYSDTSGLKEFAFKNQDYIVAYKVFQDFFYLSEDEAESWKKIKTPSINALSVIDNNIIYILSKKDKIYYLYKTFNNCISWDTIRLSFEAEGIAKLFFINQNTGWLLISNRLNNKNNKIFKTTDGGYHWHLQLDKFFSYTTGIQDIKFIDENYGFACGNMGLLLETSNGGEVWKETLYKESQYSDATCELYFPSKRIVFITDQYDVYRNILDTLNSSFENEQYLGLTEIKCLPNPANDKVKIIIPNKSLNFTSLVIYDLLGREVLFQQDIAESEFDLDVTSLNSGTYLVILNSPQGALFKMLYLIK